MCDAHHTRARLDRSNRTSRDAPPHTPPEDVMRHLSAARDILVPLAGIAFFVMLATLVA
jgi:hypothetical protein